MNICFLTCGRTLVVGSLFLLIVESFAVAVPAYAVDAGEDVSEKLLEELKTQNLSEFEELFRYESVKPAREGFASYYASRLAGRRTTSGRRYDPKKFTAAHVSLPLGSVVKVVNKKNGKDVLVTVNDRCAPKSYPFIDLSRAAADKIGIVGKGKAPVEIIPLKDNRLKIKG